MTRPIAVTQDIINIIKKAKRKNITDIVLPAVIAIHTTEKNVFKPTLRKEKVKESEEALQT